jgi:hypothetical protein
MPDFHFHHLNQYTHEPEEEGKSWAGSKWWRESTGGDASSGLFTVTSDLECDFMSADPGGCGIDFYYSALPEGYAYFVLPEHQTTEGLITSFIQDLRPVNSPPVLWNVEIAAFRVDPGKRRAAYQILFGQDSVETYSRFKTQKLPAGRASLNWFQTSWPSDGKVLFDKVHTHSYAAEMWLVSGSLEDCGLSSGKKENISKASRTYAVDASPLPMLGQGGENIASLEDARSYILKNMARTGKGFVCKHTFTNITDEDGRKEMVLNVRDKMRCNSLHYVFKKGEPLTTIAFSFAPPADEYPQGFQSHSIWAPFLYLAEYDDFVASELQKHYEDAASKTAEEAGPSLPPPELHAHSGPSSAALHSMRRNGHLALA